MNMVATHVRNSTHMGAGNTNLIMPMVPDAQQYGLLNNLHAAHTVRTQTQHQHQPQPQLPPQSAHTQHGRHSRSQSFQNMPSAPRDSRQISPLSTSGSNTNPSNTNGSTPVSPQNNPSRRDGALPVYMPAVLRPNLFPSKKTRRSQLQITQVQSPIQENQKLDQQQQLQQPPVDVSSSHGSNSSNDGYVKERRNSILNLASYALPRLGRRRSTQDSRCSDDEWAMEAFPEVTSEPTRKHWKPDTAVTTCDDPVCKKTFSYFTRRHHCRRCGNIFCDPHSSLEVPLDQDANYNPRASMSRSCRHCFDEFQSWKNRNSNSPSNSTASTESEVISQSPVVPSPMPQNGFFKPTTSSQEVAQSVPRDWNWSTF
ncbi:FYVE-type zinc finger-containing protein C9B6.03 [Ceratocystis fimbriata CBS 114723]|uniref:FYVE-type zinc finger-containing protein C9B6.03 n=1 Tax=Ceratocystis fimbriata CBS 114723 TaxID=1035309 RepID=A0A2C5XEK7_9PEZI|nr:FYVE-type zinc finger-containing protein C9B6.03 [Ceratocystis fimbriata CBS 114723]